MILSGTILILNGTLLPEPLRLDTDTDASGWASIANAPESHELERKFSSRGWWFFYMAGALRTTVFGFDEPR